MTGPAPGKIPVKYSEVVLICRGRRVAINPEIYIHVKGWSLARVTHIDIEYENLNNILNLRIREIVGGLFRRYYDKIQIISRKFIIEIKSELLNSLIPRGYEDKCVIGGKIDGVFIGVKKDIIKILENYASSLGYSPR